jgi:hypothetical protein
MERIKRKRNILKDTFLNIGMENLVNKKRNILYDDTIYPCDEFIWLKYDDDDKTIFTLYRHTRLHGVQSIRLCWYYFYGDWLGLTSSWSNRQMKKWTAVLYIYVKSLDREKPFYSLKTDIYKYWLKEGCYLNTSVFKIILRVFLNRTYLGPGLNGCSTIYG